MEDGEYASIILYYGRNKFYQTMHKYSIEALSKFPNNQQFILFAGMALALANRVQEAIRELNPIKNDSDLAMAVILVLIYSHKKCNIIDREELQNLDIKMKAERKKLTPSSVYFSAVFLFLSGKIEKAREYSERLIRNNPNMNEAHVINAWAQLYLNNTASKFVLEISEKTINGKINIDAFLVKVKYYQLNREFENAISFLNKLSVRYPDLNIPLHEKMETQLANWDWDYAYETALRIINLDPENIFALRIKTMILIVRDRNIEFGLKTIKQLFEAIERYETANYKLILHVTQLFSRICDRNHNIISQTKNFLESIRQNSSVIDAELYTELGYQCILLNQIKEANKLFRVATKVDDGSVHILCGLTLCQILENGISQQVCQQIEFLNEVQGIEKLPLILYLTAKITNDSEKAINLLLEACDIHFRQLKLLPFGVEYMQILDPDFLLKICEELLKHSPIPTFLKINSYSSKEPQRISTKYCLNILEVIVKSCPGLLTGIYMLARAEYFSGEETLALNTLEKILNDIDSTHADSYLLLAQIYIQKDDLINGLQKLELCLSHNFEIRSNPLFHLLTGIIRNRQTNYEEAQKSLLIALNLIGFQNADGTIIETKDSHFFNLEDKVTLFLELIDTLIQLNRHTDAEKYIKIAQNKFGDTNQAVRINIAYAEQLLHLGNIDKAIDELKSIAPTQFYYLHAKSVLANIYLKYKKDKVSFARCFKEVVENCPEPESYLSLGDAYMSILEPNLAIDAFKQALLLNPKDAILASKLGRAYVKAHQYSKAITFYQTAILNPLYIGLKLDLSELYLKLKEYSKAETILLDEIKDKMSDKSDVADLQIRTKQLLLLARIQEKSGNIKESLSTLQEAKNNQYRAQQRFSVENSCDLQQQFKLFARICVLMAEQSVLLGENQQAIELYNESLKYSPEDVKQMTALAELFMQINAMEECHAICTEILKIDSNNERASIMLADISFRKMDFQNAAFHFSQLLSSQPCYWRALSRLIEVTKRSGTLEDSKDFLNKAEQSCTSYENDAGLNYNKGLFEWYSGNPNSALRFFNNARRDSEWARESICNMIDICLCPDGDLFAEGINLDSCDERDTKDSRIMALRTAERLLKELKPNLCGTENESVIYRLQENFLRLASRQKAKIDLALTAFLDINSNPHYNEWIMPILGISLAYAMLKQFQKARNYLKRVAKNEWNFSDAEHLERCWLLLAELYSQSGKYEAANELLKNIFKYNKSCFKAYELLGYINEKEQSFKQATLNYKNAWRFCCKSKPQVGYKLAYCYMKSKQFAEAVEICQQVLQFHPDYISVKKDILVKCRNNLKC